MNPYPNRRHATTADEDDLDRDIDECDACGEKLCSDHADAAVLLARAIEWGR